MVRLIGAWLLLGAGAAMAQDALPNVNYPTGVARGSSSAAPSVSMPKPGQARSTRSRDGHFYVDAAINGGSVPMMVDTGASGIFLTHQDAVRAGLNPESLNYSVRTSTANGQGLAARARLASLKIGGIVRQDVPVMVAQTGASNISLLGQTFLSQLTVFQVSGDTMVMAIQ